MKNTRNAFTSILTITILFSCSIQDLALDAKKYMENTVSTESGNYLKLIKMNTIDGGVVTVNGTYWRAFSFAAEIECVKEGAFVHITANGKLGSFQIYPQEAEDNFIRPAKVGDRYNLKGSIYFEKHKSGWEVVTYNTGY